MIRLFLIFGILCSSETYAGSIAVPIPGASSSVELDDQTLTRGSFFDTHVQGGEHWDGFCGRLDKATQLTWLDTDYSLYAGATVCFYDSGNLRAIYGRDIETIDPLGTLILRSEPVRVVAAWYKDASVGIPFVINADFAHWFETAYGRIRCDSAYYKPVSLHPSGALSECTTWGRAGTEVLMPVVGVEINFLNVRSSFDAEGLLQRFIGLEAENFGEFYFSDCARTAFFSKVEKFDGYTQVLEGTISQVNPLYLAVGGAMRSIEKVWVLPGCRALVQAWDGTIAETTL